MPGFPARLFIILLIYHLLFTLVFHQYLLAHGGDSRAYWDFTVANYRPASNWMDYFEYGNFFMQWLTYLPSQVLGLPYWAGNLIFGLASFLGFAELLRLCLNRWGWQEDKLLENAWILALFLPGVHFWTAGVGKESVLWLGTIYVLKGNTSPRKKGLWLLVGLFLTGMTRPIHGALLFLITTVYHLQDREIRNSSYRWAVLALIAVGSALSFYILLRQTHLSEWSLAALGNFFRSQQQFLEGFGAGSFVPMETYSWPERLWTVLFRPLPWEARDVWQWAAALENSVLLLLTLFGIGRWLWERPRISPPRFVMQGLLLGIGMLLIYSLTLNNLGIIMRMKSIFIPFLALLWLSCVVFTKKKVTFGGI